MTKKFHDKVKNLILIINLIQNDTKVEKNILNYLFVSKYKVEYLLPQKFQMIRLATNRFVILQTIMIFILAKKRKQPSKKKMALSRDHV
jgi:hypothetical protein